MTIRDVLDARPDLTSVVAYLRSNGWVAGERWRLSTVWTSGVGGDTTELLVPDREALDFDTRIRDLIKHVAAVEQRTVDSLVRDIATTLHDVVRVAAITDSSTSAIPINVGVSLVAGAQAMLLSAASAAVMRRAHFPTRKPARAVEYMNHVQLGQTEVGSYVVTLLSPVSPALQTGIFPDLTGEPFERSVTTVLANAVDSARAAADAAVAEGSLESFSHLVEGGVSANLCDALAELLPGDAGIDSVRVAVRWSPNGPIPRARVSAVTLGTDLRPILREAARFFREAVPEPDHELTGYVFRLQHEPEPGTAGEISITTVGSESPRVVSVLLGPEDYQEAIVAHRDIRLVTVRGRLIRTGPRASLEDAAEFAIVEDEPTE